MRTDFADQVSVFLDQADAAGARHVTYLSAYGIDSAPPETAMRSVELDLLGRPGITHAILRPSWFMQNFSETFLRPVGSRPGGDVERATGAAPASFADFARRTAAAWAVAETR
jgi:uncharacterized protein YbjT (DUF2867 family)